MRRGTYSIIARDPASGELGVASQSHWLAVGAVLGWIEPGVGVVATQSIADPAYGPRALSMLRDGTDPGTALERLLEADDASHLRQVAVLGTEGDAAVHTGRSAVPFAGHRVGDGYSCQASMMRSDTVPGAMAAAFEASGGTLAERLLAALDAAEADGGDVRGRQSAVLIVAPAEGEAWQRTIDLRVDDHPDPLAELRRLHTLARAYETSERAEELLAEGRYDEAAPLFVRAAELAPGNDELLFWAGLNTAQGGDMEEALRKVRAAADMNPRWLQLLDRLSPEIAPTAAAVRRALGRA